MSEKKHTQESKTKVLIREYLLNEGYLRENIKNPRIDFGFRFEFPKGKTPDGKSLGRSFSVVKPKKKNFIEISSGTRIDKIHVNALNSLKDKKKEQFFADLRKLFLHRDVFFHIDLKDHRYVVIDTIYLAKNGGIPKDFFYRIIRKLFTSVILSVILLNEYISGKVKPEDFSYTKSPGDSLYL